MIYHNFILRRDVFFRILLIPTFGYFGSICVLYMRQYLISKDPGHKIVQRDEAADPVIYLY